MSARRIRLPLFVVVHRAAFGIVACALLGCGGATSVGPETAVTAARTAENGNGDPDTCAIVRVVSIGEHDLRFLAPASDSIRAEWASRHGPEIDAELAGEPASGFPHEEEVRASHILVAVEEGADAVTRNAARTRAEAILARALSGEPFDALARETTDDVTEFDGDLGWFRRGTMIAAFEAACFAAPSPSVIPHVVETAFGLHIVLVSGHRPAGDLSAPERRADAIERLYLDVRLALGRAILDRALADVRTGRVTLDAMLESTFGRMRERLTDVASEPVLLENGRLYFGPFGQRVEAAPIDAIHRLAPGELLPELVPDDRAVVIVAGASRAPVADPACAVTLHGDDEALLRALREAIGEN